MTVLLLTQWDGPSCELPIETQVELQVVVVGPQSSCQYCCSTGLLVFVNSRFNQCQSFVMQYANDFVLSVNTVNSIKPSLFR